MGTEIKTWQIVDGKLQSITTNLKNEKRTEVRTTSEPWLECQSGDSRTDIVIIGRQTMTKSGPIDLLGIDKTGNVVVVEIRARRNFPARPLLKRSITLRAPPSGQSTSSARFARSTPARGSKKPSSIFPGHRCRDLNINDTQRIILVGFSVESALERMIEWLWNNFNVNINAVVLSYVKTATEMNF